MDIDKRIDSIKDRFEISRASVMTQIFVTVATAHGVGMAAVLSMIGQLESSPTILFYLTIIVFFLGIGLTLIIVSALYRFEHSKVAEKEKIAKLTKNICEQKIRSKQRKALMLKYKAFMYASISCLLIAVFIGAFGAVHNYCQMKLNEGKRELNKVNTVQAPSSPIRMTMEPAPKHWHYYQLNQILL